MNRTHPLHAAGWQRFIILILTFPIVIGLLWWTANTVITRAMAVDDRVRKAVVASAYTERVELHLVEGWNLISVPVHATYLQTAADLIEDIALQGGYVTTVSFWNGDRWVEVSQRGAERYGHDFPLEVGMAYFVRNHLEMTWMVEGAPIRPEELALSLQKGWNAVGLGSFEAEAGSFVDSLQSQQSGLLGMDAFEGEVDRWRGGIWDPFVKRWYSGSEVEEYGENFMIEPLQGYFVRVEKDIEWRHAE